MSINLSSQPARPRPVSAGVGSPVAVTDHRLSPPHQACNGVCLYQIQHTRWPLRDALPILPRARASQCDCVSSHQTNSRPVALLSAIIHGHGMRLGHYLDGRGRCCPKSRVWCCLVRQGRDAIRGAEQHQNPRSYKVTRRIRPRQMPPPQSPNVHLCRLDGRWCLVASLCNELITSDTRSMTAMAFVRGALPDRVCTA